MIIAWLLSKYARARARLVFSVRHASTIQIDEPLKDAEGKLIAQRQFIHTASVTVSNVGTDTAKNVELVFDYRPMFLSIWPVRHYEERQSAHNTFSLLFASLAPNEALNVEAVAINAGLPAVATVRSDEATAEQRVLNWQPVQPPWKVAMWVWFATLGIAATGYLVASAIQLISAG